MITIDELRSLAAELDACPLSSREGKERLIIARIYYFAYHLAMDYTVRWLGFRPTASGEDHGGLRAHLKQKRRAQVAVSLDRLRTLRNKADYDLGSSLDFGAMIPNAWQDANYVRDALPPAARP